MQISAEKNHSCFAAMSRIVFVFESFLNGQMRNEILFLLFLRANVICLNCLAMVNIIISVICFSKQLIYLFVVLVH